MKEKPTTFQLAQLAALVSTPLADTKLAVRKGWEIWKEAEAEITENENRTEFLRDLFGARSRKSIPIFTDTPETWNARLKAYPGDARDVAREMWNQEFANEEVQKQLFRDKAISRDTRHKLFLGLAKASIIFDVEGPPVATRGRLTYLNGPFTEPEEGFPIHPKNLERAEQNHRGLGKMLIPANEVSFVKGVVGLLSAPKLNAHVVRWAVEVRQKQLAQAKTRIIPESLRRKNEKRSRDENIQFKKKHIQ